jgi:hypothetical protein
VTLARHDAQAVALATERLELLRSGPRADGADAAAAPDATAFTRAWRITPGRGRPDGLAVAVAWPGHDLRAGTRAMP